MSQKEKLIKLRCSVCKRDNYFTRKNRKSVTRKIELLKFCNWDRKKVKHTEARV